MIASRNDWRTKTYHAFDFWSRAPLPDFRGVFMFDVPAESCRIVAVRADEGHPVLVSNSRHVTQGIVDVTNEKWRRNELSATSQVVAGDPYEWKVVSTVVSAADRAGGVRITAQSQEAGWRRLTIASKDSRAVKWSVNCESKRLVPDRTAYENLCIPHEQWLNAGRRWSRERAGDPDEDGLAD